MRVLGAPSVLTESPGPPAPAVPPTKTSRPPPPRYPELPPDTCSSDSGGAPNDWRISCGRVYRTPALFYYQAAETEPATSESLIDRQLHARVSPQPGRRFESSQTIGFREDPSR